MNVYVSCSSKELEIARGVMDLLRVDGHKITLDWTEGFEDEIKFGLDELSKRAVADIEAVMDCDVLVLMMTSRMMSCGCYVEIGAALACNNSVMICTEQEDFTHFFKHHPLVNLYPTFKDVRTALGILQVVEDNVFADSDELSAMLMSSRRGHHESHD